MDFFQKIFGILASGGVFALWLYIITDDKLSGRAEARELANGNKPSAKPVRKLFARRTDKH